jgi:hypothetical protein
LYKRGDFDSWETLYFNHHVTFDYDQKITAIPINFDVSDSKDIGGACGKDHLSGNVSLPLYSGRPRGPDVYKTCYTYLNENIFGFDQFQVYVDLKIIPFLDNALVQPTDNIMPMDEPITVSGPIGFDPMTYYWRFSPDFGASWYPIPSAYQNKDVFQISARQLFSGSGLDVNRYAGRNILIRMNPCGDVVSNSIFYNVRLSAPNITGVNAQSVRCFGENGRLSINFDRGLYNDLTESLTMNVWKLKPDGSKDAQLPDYTVNALNASNAFDFPDPIPPGDYLIELVDLYYPDGPAGRRLNGYAEGPGHTYRFTIYDATPVVIGTPVPGSVRCYNGNDGTISVNASGGAGGYKLYWKNVADAAYNEALLAGNTVTIGNLVAGTYTMYLRDANDCVGRDSKGNDVLTVTLSQPATPLTIDAQSITDPKAFGASDGSLTVYLKGGTPNADGSYNITLTRAGTAVPFTGSFNGATYTVTADNLPDGTYILTATDANEAGAGNKAGCTVSAELILRQPPLLEVSANVKDSVLCKGDGNGTLSAVGSGGKPMAAPLFYTYEWYQMQGGTGVALGQTGPEANGLTAGLYYVKVTDANSIEAYSDTVNLVEPDELKIQLTATPANCHGGADGVINASVSGGTPVYAYTWSNGSNAATATQLATGNYTLQVRDYHGCQAQDGTFINEPAAALQIITPVDLVYPRAAGYTDGSIQLTLTGGTPFADGSYTIEWKKADGTVLSSHTETLVTNGYQTKLSNLGAGDYIITVKDANYAAATAGAQTCFVTGKFTLTEPEPLSVTIAESHYVSCKGDTDGVLTATAAGGVRNTTGTLPYQYNWFKLAGGTAQAIGQTTDKASGLATGLYKVIITDWNNISKESDTFELKEPETLQVQLNTRKASCYDGNDGFVKSTVSGGSTPYTYSWSTGDATPDILDQQAGKYTLLLTDAHGCMQQPSATVEQPAAALAVVAVVPTNPTAYGYTDGKISVTLAGGTPEADGSYHVQWLDANGNTLSNFTTSISANGYTTELQNVGDGAYTLQVKDAQFAISTNGSTSGCYISANYTLNEPALLQATIEQYRYVSCKGYADGQLVAHGTGGIRALSGLPYRYQWFRVANGGNTLIPQTDSIITGMTAGTYIVRVTDENNITRESEPFPLGEPAQLAVSFTTTAVSCASGQDGKATAIVSGGTEPYAYEWTTGETTSSISNLTEGSYLLFVKDARGCEAQNQADIFIPGGIVIDADIKSPTCNGNCNGYIKTTISGGVGPYRYAWSNGQTGTELNNLCAGKYTLTITDANNCKRIQTFNLPDPAPLLVKLGADKTLCNGQSLNISAAITDPLAQYAWEGPKNFRATTAAVTLRNEGAYHVLVTDGKGCTGRDTIGITLKNAAISADFVVSTQVFRNEAVTLVNISNPRPEKVEWVIPANSGITVIQQTAAVAEIRFANTGVYQLGLRAFVGDCQQVFSKSITVLEAQNFPQPGGAQEPFIQQFEVMPNPNSGQFNVRISLDKQAAIRLRMINIISNELVSDRQESPATQFNVGYHLSVPAGTYLLLLETPMGNPIRKIIISQ